MDPVEFFKDTTEVHNVPEDIKTYYSRYLILFSDPNIHSDNMLDQNILTRQLLGMI